MKDKEDQYFNQATKKGVATNLRHGELLFDTLKLKFQHNAKLSSLTMLKATKKSHNFFH
jgi:hypothetical protein